MYVRIVQLLHISYDRPDFPLIFLKKENNSNKNTNDENRKRTTATRTLTMRTKRKQSPTHPFPEKQSTVDLKKTRIWNLAVLIFWVECAQLGVLKTQVDQTEEEQKGRELKGLLHL